MSTSNENVQHYSMGTAYSCVFARVINTNFLVHTHSGSSDKRDARLLSRCTLRYLYSRSTSVLHPLMETGVRKALCPKVQHQLLSFWEFAFQEVQSTCFVNVRTQYNRFFFLISQSTNCLYVSNQPNPLSQHHSTYYLSSLTTFFLSSALSVSIVALLSQITQLAPEILLAELSQLTAQLLLARLTQLTLQASVLWLTQLALWPLLAQIARLALQSSLDWLTQLKLSCSLAQLAQLTSQPFLTWRSPSEQYLIKQSLNVSIHRNLLIQNLAQLLRTKRYSDFFFPLSALSLLNSQNYS